MHSGGPIAARGEGPPLPILSILPNLPPMMRVERAAQCADDVGQRVREVFVFAAPEAMCSIRWNTNSLDGTMLNHAFDRCQTRAVRFQWNRRPAIANDWRFARFAINAARQGMLNAAQDSMPVYCLCINFRFAHVLLKISK